MTAMALIIGFGIGWLLCGIIMKRAHKKNLDHQRRLYASHYEKAIRQEIKTSKSKNQ